MMPQQPQQPYGYGPPPSGYGPPQTPQKQKNSNAALAMWLGLASFVTCGFAGVPALFFGLKAKKEVDAEPQRYSNPGQAMVGIVLGAFGCFVVVLAIIGMVLPKDKSAKPAVASAATPEATTAAATTTASAVTKPTGMPSAAPATASAATVASATGGAKIGDVVTFDDSEWTVLDAKNKGKTLASNNMFQQAAKTDGKFIYVKFKVKNLTNKEDRIMDGPKLVDGQGREFGEMDDASFYIGANEKTLTMEALPASIAKTFGAVYEVPADATNLSFQARALSAFGDKQLVSLGL